MSYFAIFLALVGVFLLKLYYDFKKSFTYWKKKRVPFLEPDFPFGCLSKLFLGIGGIGNSVEEWYKKAKGKYVGVYCFDSHCLLVKDPELIKLILVKEFNIFPERGMYLDEHKYPGSGQLFKLRVHKWRFMRSKLSSCFSSAKIKMMFQNMIESGQQLNRFLDENLEKNIVDITDICDRFSIDIIASFVYGIELNSFLDKDNKFYKQSMSIFQSDSYVRIAMAGMQVFYPEFFDKLTFLSLEVVKTGPFVYIKKVIEDVIQFREKNNVTRNDMVQLFIQLKNDGKIQEDKNTKSEQNIPEDDCIRLNTMDIVAQAYTFLFAGFETSSSTLGYLLYECGLNTTVQKRIQNEIDSVLDKYNGEISYQSILEMKYLDTVIAETLRKYPILPFLQRSAVQDYKLPDSGVVIEKNTRIFISVSGLHRDPEHYPNPELFDPNRFSKESESKRQPFTYLPFGEGPRNCIGLRLAKFIVAIGAVIVLKSFKLEKCPDTEVPLKMNCWSYSEKPLKNIQLKIVKR